MHTIPAISSVVFGTLWLICSPTRVYQTHPQYFLLSLGFLFALLVGKTVLARVCGKMFVSPFQPLTLPLIFAYVNALLKQYLHSPTKCV